MGRWGTGPFDEDTAADWCDVLDGLPAAERAPFVRVTLRAVLETTDYFAQLHAVRALLAPVRPNGDSDSDPTLW